MPPSFSLTPIQSLIYLESPIDLIHCKCNASFPLLYEFNFLCLWFFFSLFSIAIFVHCEFQDQRKSPLLKKRGHCVKLSFVFLAWLHKYELYLTKNLATVLSQHQYVTHSLWISIYYASISILLKSLCHFFFRSRLMVMGTFWLWCSRILFEFLDFVV